MWTSVQVTIIVLLLLNICTVSPSCVDRCKARYKKMKWNTLANCIHNRCTYKKRGFQSLEEERFITDSTQAHPDSHCILDNMWNDLSTSSQDFILKVFDSELNFDNPQKENH